MANYKWPTYESLMHRDGVNCFICGRSLSVELEKLKNWYDKKKYYEERKLKFSHRSRRRKDIDINIDHVIPRSKGGANDFSNYALTHRNCNRLKADKTIEYAREKILSGANNPAGNNSAVCGGVAGTD